MKENFYIIIIHMYHFVSYWQQDRSRNRFVMLLGCAMLSVFGSNMAQFSGAGALGVLVMATVASYGWGDVEKVGASTWAYIQAAVRVKIHKHAYTVYIGVS